MARREWKPLCRGADARVESDLLFLKACAKIVVGADFSRERGRLAELDEVIAEEERKRGDR